MNINAYGKTIMDCEFSEFPSPTGVNHYESLRKTGQYQVKEVSVPYRG